MELWIRSQNGEHLGKVKSINYWFKTKQLGDKDGQHSIVDEDLGILGVYKSKERCLEILDEIEYLIMPIIKCEKPKYENLTSFIGAVTQLELERINVEVLKQANAFVYHMPKE